VKIINLLLAAILACTISSDLHADRSQNDSNANFHATIHNDSSKVVKATIRIASSYTGYETIPSRSKVRINKQIRYTGQPGDMSVYIFDPENTKHSIAHLNFERRKGGISWYGEFALDNGSTSMYLQVRSNKWGDRVIKCSDFKTAKGFYGLNNPSSGTGDIYITKVPYINDDNIMKSIDGSEMIVRYRGN
jgi:hypothetical protein